jgi:hypothetical protein
METVEHILKDAATYGLQDEVQIFALRLLRTYPKMDELQAYTIAHGEWIK